MRPATTARLRWVRRVRRSATTRPRYGPSRARRGPEGAVAWSTIDDELGVDLEPESRPVIRIVLALGDVEAMARESGVPLAMAMGRASDWGRVIEGAATKRCRSRLCAAVRGERP